MNQQNAADVAMAFVTRINEHDVDGLVALMTPDHLFVDALDNTFRGADQMRQGWKGYFAMFPDYAIEVIDELDCGNLVAMFGKARGGRWPRTASCPERISGKYRLPGRLW